MTAARATIHGVRFATELVALAAWLSVGLELGGPAVAIVAPAIAAAVWGRWMAPKSAVRLDDPKRLAAEVIFFAVPSLLVAAFGRPAAGSLGFVIATITAIATRVPPFAVVSRRPSTDEVAEALAARGLRLRAVVAEQRGIGSLVTHEVQGRPALPSSHDEADCSKVAMASSAILSVRSCRGMKPSRPVGVTPPRADCQ